MKKPENSGRKKGSKNIRKVAKVADVLAEGNLNPAEEILKIVKGVDDMDRPLLNPKEKADVWLDLLSYCQSKPKAFELDDDGIDPELYEDIDDADLLKLVKNSSGD